MKIKDWILAVGLVIGMALAIVPGAAMAEKKCVPKELTGTGTPTTIQTNEFGATVSWWCDDDGFGWMLSYYAVTWEFLGTQLRADLSALNQQPDTKAAVDALREKYKPNPDPLSDPAIAQVISSEVAGKIIASKPADPVWKVAKNGSYLTRPAYPWVLNATTGVYERRKTSSGSVPVDSLCKCAPVRRVEGASKTTYCEAPAPAAGASSPTPIKLAICSRVS